MNIELEEVAVQDVSDDALEMAAGGAQGGPTTYYPPLCAGGTVPVNTVAGLGC